MNLLNHINILLIMTLKNSLITIEKLTPILRYRIALRLRSVICILIFSICILLGQNNCFAQYFETQVNSDVYNYNEIPSSGYDTAVLMWKVQPRNNVHHVVSASIVPFYAVNDNSLIASVGFAEHYGEASSEDSYTIYYTLVNSKDMILRNGTLGVRIRQDLNNLLISSGLGTVSERKSFIAFIRGHVVLSPVDFRSYLQPWIILGLVIAILIPAWYLMRRFLRG